MGAGSFRAAVPPDDHWLRYKADPYANAWLLPLDIDQWPPLGGLPQPAGTVDVLNSNAAVYRDYSGNEVVGPLNAHRVDYRNAPANWGLPLTPFCQHGRVAETVDGRNLRDLLAINARMVIATHRAVNVELPPVAVE